MSDARYLDPEWVRGEIEQVKCGSHKNCPFTRDDLVAIEHEFVLALAERDCELDSILKGHPVEVAKLLRDAWKEVEGE